jgi:L-iditol 2-dehydrogenase
MTATMRALRVHGVRDVRLEELPRPEPGPGEVLVRIAAVGICRTDLELYDGIHGAILSGIQQYPFVPAHEWCGDVVQVGEGVDNLQVGDRVIGETGIGCLRCPLCLSGHHQLCPNGTETGIVRRAGAMREYHVQAATFVHRFDGAAHLGALVEPASVGVYSCHKVGVSPLCRVAVIGGGAIGQCCLQAARAFGARQTVMVSRSAPKLAMAQRHGADAVVNSKTTDLVAAARELTEGDLFDVVIEAAGTEGAFRDALLVGGYVSRIALVGYSAREPFGHGLETVIYREQTIIGVRGSPHVYPQTIALMARGDLQLEELVSHRYPLAQYQEAFAVAEAGGPEVMRVLIEM